MLSQKRLPQEGVLSEPMASWRLLKPSFLHNSDMLERKLVVSLHGMIPAFQFSDRASQKLLDNRTKHDCIDFFEDSISSVLEILSRVAAMDLSGQRQWH